MIVLRRQAQVQHNCSSAKNFSREPKFSLLPKTKSYGIFRHPPMKGRPNLSINMHKSLSGLTRPYECQVSFRASSDSAN
jgi:hypothetical protein